MVIEEVPSRFPGVNWVGNLQSITDFAVTSRPGPVWSGTLPGCFSPRFSDPVIMRSNLKDVCGYVPHK